MTKKRSSSKPSTPIGLLRGAIGDRKIAKNLKNALEEFKLRGPVEKYPVAYVQAAHSAQFSNVIPAGRKIVSYGQLGFTRPLAFGTFSREVQWAAVICYVSRSVIKAYLSLRTSFFEKFAAGNFKAAEALLDEIDIECGKSLWTVENRICLLNISEGFEAQKKFVTVETKKYSRSNFAFMTASIGERNEPRVTAEAFEQRLRHRSTTWDIESGQISHIFYRLCNIVDPEEEKFAAILAHEATYSSIDLYESLLDLVRRSKRMKFNKDNSAIAAIRYLDEIADERKASLIRYLLDESNAGENSSATNYQLAFSKGEYAEVVQQTSHLLESKPWSIDPIVSCAKAMSAIPLAYGGDSWLAKTLIQELKTFFSGDEEAAQAVDSITKLANNFRHADFSVPLIVLMKSRTFRWFDRVIEQAALTVIFSHVAPLFSNCATVNTPLAQVVWTSDFENTAQMYRLIIDGDFDEALPYAAALKVSTLPYYRTLGRSMYAHLLARTLAFSTSIEESVESIIDLSLPIEFTPLLAVLKDRGYRHLKSMSGSAALASAFHIFIAYTENSDKEVSLKVAWKNFLSHNGITCPSMYRPTAGYSSVERYFLSEVCIQDSMEFGQAFTSQLDLDRERMAICVNLANEDTTNAEFYNQEIVDLTRRINIEEGVELLESSRVFVDEIGIQKWAKKNLESQFLRYIDYLSAGLVESIQQLEAELSKIINTPGNQLIQLRNYLEDYDITADSLIEGVLRELSQAFLQLPRFGLDSFLSSRVRHGSFVGYIRGPLEARKIVTKKNTSVGRYHDNDAMLDRWEISGEKERRVINGRLALLSESIDNILDEMVTRYIHVKSRSHPDGMVSYATEQGLDAGSVKAWVVLLKTSLNKSVSLEKFVSYSIENFFWPAIRLSLGLVKDYVQTELAEKLIYQLQSFYVSIEGVTDKVQRERVMVDIRGSISDLHDALRRVSLWFDLPKANTQILSMPLERALEIGLISTKYTRPDFNPTVNWEIQPESNVTIHGASIGILNDFAFLVFANISKHSGFEGDISSGPGPEVWIRMRKVDGAINIHCRNEICPTKSIDDIKNGIALAENRIANRDFGSIDKQSEGTGLARLAIYFDSSDSREPSTVKFWLNEQELMFNVEFQLPPSMVKVIAINS